jgi:hypothetical protein
MLITVLLKINAQSGFMENRIKVGMFAGIMLAVLMPTVVGAQSIGSALSVYNLQTTPNPIVAGDNVTLTLQLYDSYSSTLQNVNLQLQGSYPILNFSPVSSYIISSMSQGLYGGSSNYFTYNIHIPEDTPTGTYSLNLVANYQTSTTSATGGTETVTGQSVMPLSFYVNGEPNITITSQVSEITPGQPATLTLSVSNSGYGTAKNVTVSLLNTENFTAIGSKEFHIGLLPEGGSATVLAEYQPDRYLDNGTYSIPLYVTYFSQDGKAFSETVNEPVGVLINNPNIVVNITSATPSALYRGYNQSLVLSITNIGTGSANNVSISLVPSGGVSILSSVKNYFIGSLAPGQSAAEQVLVSAGNYTVSNATIGADVRYYTQNYQSRFSKNESLVLSVASSSLFSISQGNYTILPGSTDVNISYVLKNTGNIDAKDIQVSFESQYPITPVTSSYYVPELAPGQSTTIYFQVSADSNGNPGSYPVTLYENWRQPNGAAQQSYSGSNPYFAMISSQNGGSGSLIDVVIAIVVIAAAVYIIRRRMRAKQQPKKK